MMERGSTDEVKRCCKCGKVIDGGSLTLTVVVRPFEIEDKPICMRCAADMITDEPRNWQYLEGSFIE